MFKMPMILLRWIFIFFRCVYFRLDFSSPDDEYGCLCVCVCWEWFTKSHILNKAVREIPSQQNNHNDNDKRHKAPTTSNNSFDTLELWYHCNRSSSISSICYVSDRIKPSRWTHINPLLCSRPPSYFYSGSLHIWSWMPLLQNCIYIFDMVRLLLWICSQPLFKLVVHLFVV